MTRFFAVVGMRERRVGVPKDYIIAPWVVALQCACENMAEQVGLRSFVSECGETSVSGSPC